MECHGHLAGRGVGSAQRCRERRLCSWAKHERMTVAMALATVTAYDALRNQKLVTSDGGRRPPPLVEVRPQEKVAQHSGMACEVV